MKNDKLQDFEYEEVYATYLREYKKEFNTPKIDEILEQFEVAKNTKDEELFNKCEDSYAFIRDAYGYLFEDNVHEDLI